MTDQYGLHRRIAAAMVLSAVVAVSLTAACETGPGTAMPTLSLPTPVALDPAITPLPTFDASPAATDLPPVVLEPAITPLPTAAGFEPPAPDPPDPEPPATETPVADEPLVSVGDATFAVEVAETPEERQQGLSDRPSLAEDRGMLFVYEIPYQYTFWMPRMHFPLDMIWIDSECAVVDITRDAQPEEEDEIRTDPTYYSPRQPALYVLEVNSGIAAASGIDAGDHVSFGGSIDGKFGC